jgi:thymidylate kinase
VGTPERPAERRDKNTQALPLLLGRSLLYLLDLAHLRSLIRRMESEGTGVIIFDRYIYDQLAALPMTSSIVRAYARLVLRLAPKPDLSVVLDAMPEAARARKPEYPLEFMKSYRSSYLRLCDLADLQLIPAGTVEDVHQAILSRAATCIANSAPAPEISSTVIA